MPAWLQVSLGPDTQLTWLLALPCPALCLPAWLQVRVGPDAQLTWLLDCPAAILLT